jgi:dolichol-phosphate mannosyltransferase
MSNFKLDRFDRLTWGVILTIVLITIGRILCASRVELLPEEAYYWTYWKNPALSYFDHPPMVAWIIGLGTAVFGSTEFGVRVGMMVLGLGSTALMFAIGQIWFDRRVGLCAALLFTLLPVFLGTGLVAFPDGPLIFFWLLTLYAISRALHPELAVPHLLAGRNTVGRWQTYSWLLAGFAFGGALLSKYTAVMLAPSLLLFLVLSRSHRHWLRRPQPWIALTVAILVFSPVIWWNAQHDWASFRFQTSRTDGEGARAAMHVTTFWLLQLLVLTPMVAGLFAWAAVRAVKRGWHQRDDRWNFIAAFFVPLFLVFVRASFKTSVHVNWTAPAYLSLTLGAAAIFSEGLFSLRPRVARWWRFGGTMTGIAYGIILLLSVTSLVFGFPKGIADLHVGGWRELGKQIDEIEDEMERATGQHVIIIGWDKYNLASELGFYMNEPEHSVNTYIIGKRGLGYRYWTDLYQFDGWPAVVVFKNKPDNKSLAHLQNIFARVEDSVRLEVPAGPRQSRAVYLVKCYSFRSSTQPLKELSRKGVVE